MPVGDFYHEPIFVYWGKKGGGLDFVVDTVNGISQFSSRPLNLSVRRENFEYIQANTNAVVFNFPPKLIPHRKYSPFFYLILEPVFSRIRNTLFWRNCRSFNVYILMSSPWDSKLKSNENQNLVRIIHDAERHPGDIWPRNRTIERWTKNSDFITLSNYVNETLEKKYNVSSIACLTLRRNSSIEFEQLNIPEEYILICGRIKTYKNLSQTLDLLLRSTTLPIIIAGNIQGKISIETKQIVIIDRWLASGELELLIANARLLICNYAEASQSGIIETGMYYGVSILSSDAGGLKEQLRYYKNCRIVPRGNQEAFNAGIQELLRRKKERKFRDEGILRPNFAGFILEHHF